EEIRPETTDFEAARGIELSQPIEGCRREEVDRREVEEGVRRHRLVRDPIPTRESLDIRPVLLEARTLRGACNEPHRPSKVLAQDTADVIAVRSQVRAIWALDSHGRHRSLDC